MSRCSGPSTRVRPARRGSRGLLEQMRFLGAGRVARPAAIYVPLRTGSPRSTQNGVRTPKRKIRSASFGLMRNPQALVDLRGSEMEPIGLEPTTSCMPCKRVSEAKPASRSRNPRLARYLDIAPVASSSNSQHQYRVHGHAIPWQKRGWGCPWTPSMRSHRCTVPVAARSGVGGPNHCRERRTSRTAVSSVRNAVSWNLPHSIVAWSKPRLRSYTS